MTFRQQGNTCRRSVLIFCWEEFIMSDAKIQGVAEYFGCNVFNEETMKNRLPKSVYKSFVATQKMGTALDPAAADVIAEAMKDWAVEKGVTHYTHWFHPMTGLSAEKHDSFISPTGDGKVIMEFSGKELIKGGLMLLRSLRAV